MTENQKRKGKKSVDYTFVINVMRSTVIYQAAQVMAGTVQKTAHPHVSRVN